jgi:hypothetical protein
VLVLGAVCSGACEGDSRSVVDTELGPGEDAISVVVDKDVYQPGEVVVTTIINESDRTLYYTFGCERPLVERLEGEDAIPLTVETDENLPSLTALPAGGTRNCSWDQKVWQDTTREGSERFQHYVELANVPPGEYRIGLIYFVTESEFGPGAGRTVFTQRFRVE